MGRKILAFAGSWVSINQSTPHSAAALQSRLSITPTVTGLSTYPSTYLSICLSVNDMTRLSLFPNFRRAQFLRGSADRGSPSSERKTPMEMSPWCFQQCVSRCIPSRALSTSVESLYPRQRSLTARMQRELNRVGDVAVGWPLLVIIPRN